MPLFAPVIKTVFIYDRDSPQSSLSVCKKSLSNGCGFDGNSSTSRNFFVIARERTSTSSILRDAWSIFSFTADKDSPNLLNSVFTAARRFQTSLERFWIEIGRASCRERVEISVGAV